MQQPQPSEIPQADWPPVLDRFSRAHHGEPVEFIITAPDSGQHREARDLPLLGISDEIAETGECIVITAGSADGTLISHQVSHPTHVRFAEWNDGASAEVIIEADDGFVATVRVGPTNQIIPEGAILDGNFQRQ